MSRSDVGLAPPGHSLIDLTRLLTRLERILLSEQIDPSLQRSAYQRTKVGANIEYAHGLVLSLEHTGAATKSQSQKSKDQADLQRNRALLKKLQDRLYELNQLDDENADGDSASEESEEEDLLRTYAPAVVTHDTIDTENGRPAKGSSAQAAEQTSDSHLRPRRNFTATQEDRATTSGAALSDNSPGNTLGKSTTPFPPASSQRSDGEALLSHHSSEQEALTSSLLSLATALKTSTQSFSDTLSSSNPLVDRATASLDRNASGMEGAERRMSMLRRMTEGKGWWGRLSLYAWVAVLWVALILIMFIMPKLRF